MPDDAPGEQHGDGPGHQRAQIGCRQTVAIAHRQGLPSARGGHGQHGAEGAGEKEAAQHGPAVCAAPVAEGKQPAEQQEIGQRFQRDRQVKGHDQPGQRAFRAAARAQRQRQQSGRGDDLPAMMVDPQRCELPRHEDHGDRDEQPRPAQRPPTKLLQHSAQHQQEQAVKQQRPDDQRDMLCLRRSGEEAKQPDAGGDRHVEQPPPVHLPTSGGVNAMLADIEPALPAHPVPHLDQAQRIVRIDEIQRPETVGLIEGIEQAECQHRQQNDGIIARVPGLALDRRRHGVKTMCRRSSQTA